MALIMNPFYGRAPLVKLHHFNNAGIMSLVRCIFKQLNKTDNISQEFFMQLGDYLNKRGMFDNLAFMCELEKSRAAEKV